MVAVGAELDVGRAEKGDRPYTHSVAVEGTDKHVGRHGARQAVAIATGHRVAIEHGHGAGRQRHYRRRGEDDMLHRYRAVAATCVPNTEEPNTYTVSQWDRRYRS